MFGLFGVLRETGTRLNFYNTEKKICIILWSSSCWCCEKSSNVKIPSDKKSFAIKSIGGSQRAAAAVGELWTGA